MHANEESVFHKQTNSPVLHLNKEIAQIKIYREEYLTRCDLSISDSVVFHHSKFKHFLARTLPTARLTKRYNRSQLISGQGKYKMEQRRRGATAAGLRCRCLPSESCLCRG